MKPKYILSVLMSVMILYSMVVIPVQAAEVQNSFVGSNATQTSGETLTYGDYEYEVKDDNTVTITKYEGSDINVIIPNTIDGKSVTSIGDWAFHNCKNIISIQVSDNVTSIGENAFSYCTSMTSISLPDNVTSISGYAFAGCNSLPNITIPKNLTSIEDDMFYNCQSLNNIVIPNGVTSICDHAFAYCTNLTSIELPDSLIDIEGSAFDGCNSLSSITIPDSVTSIGSWAFDGCSSLTNITIPKNVSSIGSGVFCSCTKLSSIYVDPKNEYFTFNEGILYDKNITKIITCLATKSPVTIPDSVTSIGDCAFIFCKNISNITLPDSLTEIGYQAFLGCDGLTTITIPESVTTISNNTFEYCDNLSSITIYDNVTKIGENAFYGCTSLTEVNYSGSLTKWKEIEIEEGNECLRNATLNHTYEVTWKNYDGSVLEKDEKLMFEEMPSYDGKTPTKENTAQYTYTFTGWSPKISPVTHDIAYTAQYKTTINTYTVTWKNYDGTVLQTDPNVKYGVRPKYNGTTPTQPKTAQYTYTFDKWSPDISIVKGDVTYKAQYKSSVNKYRVIWKNYDGKTLETDENVQYGTNPTYDGKTPTRESTE